MRLHFKKSLGVTDMAMFMPCLCQKGTFDFFLNYQLWILAQYPSFWFIPSKISLHSLARQVSHCGRLNWRAGHEHTTQTCRLQPFQAKGEFLLHRFYRSTWKTGRRYPHSLRTNVRRPHSDDRAFLAQSLQLLTTTTKSENWIRSSNKWIFFVLSSPVSRFCQWEPFRHFQLQCKKHEHVYLLYLDILYISLWTCWAKRSGHRVKQCSLSWRKAEEIFYFNRICYSCCSRNYIEDFHCHC